MDSAGVVRTESREYFKFAYDYSYLQETHEVFMEGVFRLEKNDPALLQQWSQEALAYRKQTQPFGVATGGCFFQNISEEEQKKNHLKTRSVGYLIDQLGLKGHQIGSFVISDKHANFIINTGDGKPEDLAELVRFIKSKVKEKYGVSLKEEVKII
jgi:UDP-N-acetylmuramate dehydrogenase